MHLVALMIVRNEAHSIAATLGSIRPFVDSWCVLDTGSTDGTPEAASAAMAGLPGAVHRAPFVDFSSARNRAMRLAGAAVPGAYGVWLDGDDVLMNGERLRGALSASPGSCFSMRHEWSDGQTFTRPTVVRLDTGWRYLGRVHELLSHPSERPTTMTGPYVRHELNAVGVAKSVARYHRDVEWLREDVEADPTNARAWFYLARTYAALGRTDEAIAAFRRRLTTRGEAYELEQAAMWLSRLSRSKHARRRTLC